MVYENEGVLIKQEEKNLVSSLIAGAVLGSVLGLIFKNIILGFSLLSILGLFVGSLINIINRNKKISK